MSSINTATVQSLRSTGYRVYVKHLRYYQLHNVTDFGEVITFQVPDLLTRTEAQQIFSGIPGVLEPQARGGRTEVEIYQGEALVASGSATCSKNDGYNKKIGRTIALGRALENCMNNWSEILEEIGTENVKKFVTKEINARQFESFSTNARKLVRQYGAEEVRSRARKALRRRNISV